ncbi:hypothetical protein HQ39_04915 [Porphyromonas sp. COT-108 OH2963]|nr:hypothetical protein HQ39_04915 [Porphyromonas sp. COT-108 OH2963]
MQEHRFLLFFVETFVSESVQRVEQTGLELWLNLFGDLKQGAIVGNWGLSCGDQDAVCTTQDLSSGSEQVQGKFYICLSSFLLRLIVKTETTP